MVNFLMVRESDWSLEGHRVEFSMTEVPLIKADPLSFPVHLSQWLPTAPGVCVCVCVCVSASDLQQRTTKHIACSERCSM